MSGPFAVSIKTDLRPGPANPDFERHYAEVLEEVQLADRLGYRAVWTTEHHGQDDGYLAAQFTALAAFAAVTTRLRLGTGVLVLPYYKLRQVLESAVIVDVLSGGRLEIGVGVGQYAREFAFFGVDMRRRGRLLEEGIRGLRQGLCAGGLPDGPRGAVVPVTPRPVQDRVPILVGGWAPAAIDRAARLGDGYVGADSKPEAGAPEFYEQLLEPALQRRGRSLDDFRYVLGVPLWVTDDAERDWAGEYGAAFRYQQQQYAKADGVDPASLRFDPGSLLIGSAAEIATRLATTWERAPWHEVVFYPRLPGVSHDRAMEQLERVATELVPALAEAVDTPGSR